MNAIELLKAQHRETEQLFEKIESLLVIEEKQTIFSELSLKLRAHMDAEEHIFYPAIEEIDESRVEHAKDQHEDAKELLDEIEEINDSGQFDAKLAVLKEKVAAHIKEEETRLLSRCRDELGLDALEHLGEELQEFLEGIKHIDVSQVTKEGGVSL